MNGRNRTAMAFALLLVGCAPSGTPGGLAPDPYAGMTPAAASDSSNRRMLAHRYDEALGFLSHIERAGGGRSADFEGAYATALGNAAFQARVVDGVPIPITRSAVERVAMLREAFARVQTGLERSNSPTQRRNLIAVSAGQLNLWGFPREAYQAYWSAHDQAPLEGSTASEALGVEQLLADPLRAVAGPTGSPAKR